MIPECKYRVHLGYTLAMLPKAWPKSLVVVRWGLSQKFGIALPFHKEEGREGVCRQCEQDLDMASSWARGNEDARRVVGVGKEGRGCKGALLSLLVFASYQTNFLLSTLFLSFSSLSSLLSLVL